MPQALRFVRHQLPIWRDDPQRPQDASEKRLNFSLCNHLNRFRADHPMFQFEHEAPQMGRRTIDIGVLGTDESTLIGTRVYSSYEPFFVIEAKRLPAPPGKDREREYVTGTARNSDSPTGGIQRFKLGLHGAGVETAAMVGYIESGLPPQWIRAINQWIRELAAATPTDDCQWSESDALQTGRVDAARGISTSTSVHTRSSACVTDSISLHHLWIVMNP